MSNNKILTLVLIAIILLSVSLLSADCRLMALMGVNGHNLSAVSNGDTTFTHFTYPSLMRLQQLGATNDDGWGLVWYDYTDNGAQINPTNILRDSVAANVDPLFVDAIAQIGASTPKILMGHVRKASSGSSNIPDPHPFIMRYGDRDYSFMHNGTVDADSIETLIQNSDPTWLIAHPFVTNVDSERYFSWIMLNIHLENGNILQGIKNALLPIYNEATASSSYSHINFILSDGLDIYAYKQTSDNESPSMAHPLAYFYDMDHESRNHRYTGVMSQFPETNTSDPLTYPIQWNSTTVTHQLEKNELVFLSSTGNIVRFREFVKPTDNTKYSHRLAFHSGVNWTGFPVMSYGESATVSSILTPYTSPIGGGLYDVRYGAEDDEHVTWINSWSYPDFPLDQTSLYKISLTNDSPQIHNMTSGQAQNEFRIANGSFIDPSGPVLTSIIADTPYWISYTLLPSQNIRDAFGPNWLKVKSVRAEDWFYSIPPVDPKGGGLISEPLYSWTTQGKNMDFGKGYIVTFKEDMSLFTWNRSYAPEPITPGKEKAMCFTWKDKPDYVVIDVIDVENAENVLEIGVLQDGICIGAVKTDSFPCQILAYPDYDNQSPLEFEIVYDSKAQPSIHHIYEMLDLNDFTFNGGYIIPEQDGLYQVKLNGSDTAYADNQLNKVRAISNYPNPFNPSTTIAFSIPETGRVRVSVYNVKGEKIKDLLNTEMTRGNHRLVWDGRDNCSNPVSSGIYFVRINTGTESHTHKMLLMK
ncbi:MAG TPA: class II glutamine amidotransferase [Candidatus Syntrophosphaera thermopropionivorans]|nr:class II glutamine amidotransferase [Candidatus Syntrophosphaera thermopropionivorans]